MCAQPFLLVTIDGGAATGKSSTAAGVARAFRLLHADTGSHYRALTLRLRSLGLTPDNSDALQSALDAIHLGSEVADDQTVITIDGNRYSREDLRADEANTWVSPFAAVPAVREKLLHYQRTQKQVAIDHGYPGLIMEGRDIGSVIFPDANLRFFLTADTETRKSRRAAQGEQDAIEERDKRDSGRKTAPLVKPEGAIEIDTSRLDLTEVVEKIVSLIQHHLQHS